MFSVNCLTDLIHQVFQDKNINDIGFLVLTIGVVDLLQVQVSEGLYFAANLFSLIPLELDCKHPHTVFMRSPTVTIVPYELLNVFLN